MSCFGLPYSLSKYISRAFRSHFFALTSRAITRSRSTSSIFWSSAIFFIASRNRVSALRDHAGLQGHQGCHGLNLVSAILSSFNNGIMLNYTPFCKLFKSSYSLYIVSRYVYYIAILFSVYFLITNSTRYIYYFTYLLCFQISVYIHRYISLAQILSMKSSSCHCFTHITTELSIGCSCVYICSTCPISERIDSQSVQVSYSLCYLLDCGL